MRRTAIDGAKRGSLAVVRSLSRAATFAGPSSITLDMLESAERRTQRDWTNRISTALLDAEPAASQACPTPSWPAILRLGASRLPAFLCPVVGTRVRHPVHVYDAPRTSRRLHTAAAPLRSSTTANASPAATANSLDPVPSSDPFQPRARPKTRPATYAASARAKPHRKSRLPSQSNANAPRTCVIDTQAVENERQQADSQSNSDERPSRQQYFWTSPSRYQALKLQQPGVEWKVHRLKSFLRLGSSRSGPVPRIPLELKGQKDAKARKVRAGDIGLALCDSIEELSLCLLSQAPTWEPGQAPSKPVINMRLASMITPVGLKRLMAIISASAFRLIDRLPTREYGWKVRHLDRARQALHTGGLVMSGIAEAVLHNKFDTFHQMSPSSILLWTSWRIRGLGLMQGFDQAMELCVHVASTCLKPPDTELLPSERISQDHFAYTLSYLFRTFTSSDLPPRYTKEDGTLVAYRDVRFEARSSALRWICSQPRLLSLVSLDHRHLRATFGIIVGKTWPLAREIFLAALPQSVPLEDKRDLLRSVADTLVYLRAPREALELQQLARTAGIRDKALIMHLLSLLSRIAQPILTEEAQSVEDLLVDMLEDIQVPPLNTVAENQTRVNVDAPAISSVLRDARRLRIAALVVAAMGDAPRALDLLEREKRVRDQRTETMLDVAQVAFNTAQIKIYASKTPEISEKTQGSHVDSTHYVNDYPERSAVVASLEGTVKASCKVGEVQEAEEAMKDLVKLSAGPASCYSILISGFLRTRQPEKALEWLQKMGQQGHPFEKTVLTSVLRYLAERGSQTGVDWILGRVEADRSLADVMLYTAAMDGYISAQRPDMALEIFAMLEQSSSPDMKPDTAAFNVALSALARSGASSKILMEHVEQMRQRGLRPDLYTYSTFLGALVRLGELPAAEDAFAEMVIEESKPIPLHYATMVGGYLRARSLRDAEYWYSEMVAREGEAELSPKKRAFINEAARGTLRDAARYVPSEDMQELDSDLAALLEELLDEAEELGQAEMQKWEAPPAGEASKLPDIRHATIILDRYRQAGFIDHLQSTWDRIFSAAVHTKDVDHKIVGLASLRTEDTSPPWPLENELCVALSIIVDGLSEAGLHGEVARTWGEVRQAGFGFDSHNWNALAMALVRAGRFEDAFRIVENVLTDDQENDDASSDEELVKLRALLADAVESPVLRLKHPRPKEDEHARAETSEAFDKLQISATFSSMSHHSGWHAYVRTIAALTSVIEGLRRGQSIAAMGGGAGSNERIDLRTVQEFYPRTLRKVDTFQTKLLKMDGMQALKQQKVDERLG